MRYKVFTFCLVAAVALMWALRFPALATAETHTVVVRDPFLSPSFFPDHITINEGDTVIWDWDAANMDEHDVRAGVTPDNPPVNYQDAFVSDLAVTGINFSHTFDRNFINTYSATNNRYEYYCLPHWAMGMVGSVTVIRVAKDFEAEPTNWQVVGGSSEEGTASCTARLAPDEDEIDIDCTHSVENAQTITLKEGSLGFNGTTVCSGVAGVNTASLDCTLNATQVEELFNGKMYIELASSSSNGLRGQIVRTGGSANIQGSVEFSDGDPVASAIVQAGNVSTSTALDGTYTLQNVPNGVYQLTSLKDGLTITADSGTNPVLVNSVTQVFKNFTATVGGGVGSGPDSDGDCVSDAQEAADGSDPDDPGSYRDHIRSPVYTLWNGFIELINILELVNKGTESLPVTIRLYDINGNEVHEVSIAIAARNQQDIIVNELPGFTENSYGIISIEFGAEFNDVLEGRMFYYRQDGQSSEYEFAFGVPFVLPSCTTSYTAFNTYQPSLNSGESGNVVTQWLSIVNLHSSAQSFTVRRYDQAGSLIGSFRVENIAPLSRFDLEGGHENPGPQNVGLNEIIPDTTGQPYVTQLFRYGGNATQGNPPTAYSFAFPLLGRAGTNESIISPISRGAGADNWMEIVNTGSTPANADLFLYNSSGTLVHSQPVSVAPHAQSHILASQYLAAGESGSAILTPAGSSAFIAQSMFYFRNETNGSIQSMYGSQAREPLGSEQFGSYNLYLGMFDWLRIINTTPSSVEVDLNVYGNSETPFQTTLQLGSHESRDLGLHESQYGTVANSYGIVELRTENGGSVAAEILRLKPDQNGLVDFAAPTIAR